MINDIQSDWPAWALLPKRETNAASFLTKYPEYDGRGIRIGILDSGIDPGAPGLQRTSDGKVKIIEMMDASGAGDVDTSTVVEAVDNEIVGLSGRKLKIPSSWKNPSNKYHIGIKTCSEMYTKHLKDRICKEEKEKFWDSHHKLLTADALRRLQEYTSSIQNSTSPLPFEKKLQREELEAYVDVLTNLDKKYNNLGPAYDCVVFNDGEMWRAVIDTTEIGNLAECKLLGPYSLTHEYGTFSSSDMLNYVVNIYDEGNLLEIVVMSSPHGTHVASIAAAYFPDNPEKNGIAPGAQIVSIGIGDIRLGSMETGSALMRAYIKAINSHCDVINMSYGESGHWVGGRIFELAHELVNKHGIIYVASGGNAGPALTTVGTPPVMPLPSIIGVGAYVSPDMMSIEYSLRERIPGMSYTWTSRGPSVNGDMGINICAPGGAITSVPNFLLRGSQLMNGTSMAAPNATGNIAILLSALQAKNLPYSPYSIQRAIEHTALKVHTWDVFSMGHGLIQVDKAFEYLENYSDAVDRNIRVNVNIGRKTGIYIREAHSLIKPITSSIIVEPCFLDAQNTDNEKKIAFNMNLNLVCDVPWVSYPSHLNLMYTSRSFAVRIDPRGLPPGVHFTWIKAFENGSSRGSLFDIPITVIKPIVVDESSNYDIRFNAMVLQPGKVFRHFFDVPQGATYATFWIRSHDTQHDCTVVIHAVQLLPDSSFRSSDFHKTFRLGAKEESTYIFKLEEKRVLELAVTKYWTQPETVTVDYCVSFHGVKPRQPQMIMHAADGIYRFDVKSMLKQEEILPAISLKYHVMPIRPTDNKISPLRQRDIIPNGRQIYEIQLTYNFSLSKATEVTPTCSLLGEILYESEYESQLWMLFDCNKQLLATGDAYPSKYSVKLEKGDYVLKLQIRHEQRALLEKVSDLPILIQMKLPAAINLDVYDKYPAALIGGKKCSSVILTCGPTVPFYVAPLPVDKLPKSSSSGHYLLGSMNIIKDENVKKIDTFPFKYIITEPPAKKSSKDKDKEKEKEKTVEEEYAESCRDLKISWMSKLDNKICKEIFDEIISKDSSNLPAILARLQFLEDKLNSMKNSDKGKEKEIPGTKYNDNLLTSEISSSESKVKDKSSETSIIADVTAYNLEVIQLADKILNNVNLIEVLAFFGSKSDKKENPNCKNLEKQKSAIIEALTKKGNALCNLAANSIEYVNNSKEGEGDSDSKDVISQSSTNDVSPTKSALSAADEVYKELQKWIDLTDSKVASFTENHSLVHKHYGRALKLYFKQLEEKPVLEIEKKCIEVFEKLGATHCADYFTRSLPVKYPLSYRPF